MRSLLTVLTFMWMLMSAQFANATCYDSYRSLGNGLLKTNPSGAPTKDDSNAAEESYFILAQLFAEARKTNPDMTAFKTFKPVAQFLDRVQKAQTGTDPKISETGIAKRVLRIMQQQELKRKSTLCRGLTGKYDLDAMVFLRNVYVFLGYNKDTIIGMEENLYYKWKGEISFHAPKLDISLFEFVADEAERAADAKKERSIDSLRN